MFQIAFKEWILVVDVDVQVVVHSHAASVLKLISIILVSKSLRHILTKCGLA